MTNNWSDIGNASLVLVWGANPSENHPACMAHINRARDKGAKLVVVDPRKTRTAVVADKYIRMRPGTDIALVNGVLRAIIAKMEDTADTSITATQRQQFFAFLNQRESDAANATRNQYHTDGNAVGDATSSSTLQFVPGGSKYTDARFLVQPSGADYVRGRVKAATGLVTTDGPDNTTISNLPLKAHTIYGDTVDGTATGALISPAQNDNTVFNKLKQHLAPYTADVVSGITGVSASDIAYLADAFIANSRCSTIGGALATQDPRVAGYKVTTMLYAMGITQHTCGGQNVKSFAVIQTIMGNMGRAGGGINALRGIHNVQGSTDQGLLYGNIPYYSSNPSATQTYSQYIDSLWGLPLNGSGKRTKMDGTYADSYDTAMMALQQRGFANMTYNFFGNHTANNVAGSWMTTDATAGVLPKPLTDGLYALWPKGNGDDHITMFRKMGTGETKSLVCWGQNPAVTEPNQSKIRDGLYNLNTLVVVDLFATETAMVSRKPGGMTYLIPACSHVEEAGSVVNSGRVLQWREKATEPKGKTKSDIELMLRFAHALAGAGAFAHLATQWAALGKAGLDPWTVLYGRYNWTPGAGASDFETAATGTADIWRGAELTPRAPGAVFGSEWIAEQVYREMNTPAQGVSWLYTGAYSDPRGTNKHLNQVDWQTANRSKSRNTTDWNNTLAFPGWGYSWLVNRRVFYNNADIPGDVTDYYMGPDACSRLFVSTNTATLNYSRWYRTIHRLADAPDTCLPVVAGVPTAVAPHVLPGRFPAHTEPYETPREDLAATWGRNTKGTAQWDLIKADSNVAATGRSHDPSEFPFILTSIRCVEHFQGGPITRNNPWNVEAEPEPWVEINSVDAIKLGISDGQYVNLVTARADSMGTLAHETAFSTPGWAKGFKARVGAGTQANQRVAPGVVAIPWHWGDQGLSKGSRANDLCIDAGDANTMIPESKACLCKIVKL